MENKSAVLAILFIMIIALMLIGIKLILFFIDFNRSTRYLISEIRRAQSKSEYLYWRRELRCHYLCLIPFVNEGNALKLYRLFHRRKR